MGAYTLLIMHLLGDSTAPAECIIRPELQTEKAKSGRQDSGHLWSEGVFTPMSSGAIEVFTEQLVNRLARLREEADSLRGRLAVLAEQEAELEIALKWAKALEAEEPQAVGARSTKSLPEPTETASHATSQRSHFFGQSLPVAAASLIKSRGQPLSEDEILNGLLAGGVHMVSKRPIVNLRFALRRRPDLVVLSGGKWDVVPGADFTPPPSGAVARSPDHLRKTMEGMAAAKERGVMGGRRPMLDKRALVYELLNSGLSPAQASERAGVSKSVVYTWLRADKKEAEGSAETAPEPKV